MKTEYELNESQLEDISGGCIYKPSPHRPSIPTFPKPSRKRRQTRRVIKIGPFGIPIVVTIPSW